MKKTWSKVLATVLVLAMVLCMPGFAASVDTVDYDADHATSADELTDADLPELLSASGNHYPIVMVHGLFGWGGTEVLGLNYWGGFSSLRDILNNAGYVDRPRRQQLGPRLRAVCLPRRRHGRLRCVSLCHERSCPLRPHVPGRPAGAEQSGQRAQGAPDRPQHGRRDDPYAGAAA